SAVTGDCGRARDAIRDELLKQHLDVAVQSLFAPRPGSVVTLEKLHDAISGCRRVHCLIGTKGGACPPAGDAARFADFLPAGVTEATYTQWEYYFASHYMPDDVWLYFAGPDYLPDRTGTDADDHADLQAAFVALLTKARASDRQRFETIGDARAAVLAVEYGLK